MTKKMNKKESVMLHQLTLEITTLSAVLNKLAKSVLKEW